MVRALRIAGLAVLLLCVAGLAFASGGTEASKQKPVTLEWWFGSFSAEKPTQEPQLAKEFAAAYPNINLKEVPVPWTGMFEKYLAALAAKQGPDVVDIAANWTRQFIETGGIRDASDVINEIGKDKIVPVALGNVSFNGKYWGVPFRLDTDSLYCNTAMFADAGLTPPKTLDEFLSHAKKLTHKNAQGVVDVYGTALALNKKDSSVAGKWYRWILDGFGGDVISTDGKQATLNTPAAIKAFKFYKDLYVTNKVMPPDSLNLDNDDVRRLFEQGKIAMGITGPWGIASLQSSAPDLKYSVALLPGASADKPGRYEIGGWNLVATSWSKVKDAQKTFMLFMARPEVCAYYTDALPGIIKAGDAPNFQTPQMKTFVTQTFKYAAPMPPTTEITGIYQAIIVAIQRILLGEDTDAVAKEVNQEVQAMLDK